jgi:hypothetical protein
MTIEYVFSEQQPELVQDRNSSAISAATAAPVTPSSGRPQSKIKHGSRIILAVFNPSTSLQFASPALQKIALMINNNIITMLPPSIILVAENSETIVGKSHHFKQSAE